ncbi:MAG TPA: PEP-CTERM sorting domain-containing protein [Candidatus Aquabacterium excrementipullorum]|nr:PEP-CTERM sorting domain-containing protein [Candidatus Aquabacterium excrementipullorum]
MRVTRVLLPLALSLVTCVAQADLLYTFDNDAQGFSLNAGGALVHQTESGNGFLQATDLDLSDVLLSLPLGGATVDWSGYAGGTLSFDARILNGTPPDWPGFGVVTLSSASGSLSLDIVPADTDPTPNWKTYSVTLDAATWGASLPSVLANLQSVTINLESGNGPIEVVGVDNVRVTAVPEPGVVAMVLAGVAIVGTAGLRRRQG